MKTRTLPVLLAVSLLVFSNSGAAQANPDSVHHRNNCRLAAQALTTGNPAPRLEWAWTYIHRCSPSERLIVYRAVIQQVRGSSDVRLLHRAIMPAVWFHDGRLFQDILDLAGDPGAAVPARVVALVALARISRPESAANYEKFIGGVDENGLPMAHCTGHISDPVSAVEGPNPLPSDYRERINSLAARLAKDAANPQDVRSAAVCTY